MSHCRSRGLELHGLLPSRVQACVTLRGSVLLIEFLHAMLFYWQLLANGCIRAIVGLAGCFVCKAGCLLMQLLMSCRARRVFPTLSQLHATQSCSIHGLKTNLRTTKQQLVSPARNFLFSPPMHESESRSSASSSSFEHNFVPPAVRRQDPGHSTI